MCPYPTFSRLPQAQIVHFQHSQSQQFTGSLLVRLFLSPVCTAGLQLYKCQRTKAHSHSILRLCPLYPCEVTPTVYIHLRFHDTSCEILRSLHVKYSSSPFYSRCSLVWPQWYNASSSRDYIGIKVLRCIPV